MDAVEGKVDTWGSQSGKDVANLTTVRTTDLEYNLISAGNVTYGFFWHICNYI